MKTLRLIGFAAWRNSLEQWSWRSFMITLVLNQSIGPLIGLLVWTSVDSGSVEIRAYFVVMLAVQLLTVSYEDHTLCGSIFDGSITRQLLLPQPVIVDLAGANLSLRFWHTTFGLPVVVAVGVATGIALDTRDLLLATPAMLVAGALRFLFTLTFAMTAFWTERAIALVSLGNVVISLLGGAAAPMFLLPVGLADVGRLLPFWSMLGLPSEIAAGVLTHQQIVAGYAVQAIWLVVLVPVAMLVWRRGLRTFTAVGA